MVFLCVKVVCISIIAKLFFFQNQTHIYVTYVSIHIIVP